VGYPAKYDFNRGGEFSKNIRQNLSSILLRTRLTQFKIHPTAAPLSKQKRFFSILCGPFFKAEPGLDPLKLALFDRFNPECPFETYGFRDELGLIR
jgi:hypothetical protein